MLIASTRSELPVGAMPCDLFRDTTEGGDTEPTNEYRQILNFEDASPSTDREGSSARRRSACLAEQASAS
jgi:hypothetical protein